MGSITTGLAFGAASATSVLPTGLARTTLDTLGQWIVNGRFPPGEVMPTEPELAASLGVSRTTVRDAVKVLSGKGLVRTARRYGTRVTPEATWNLLDADVIAWHDPDHPRMRRIFAESTELRAIVEPAAAGLAAARATPEQRSVILAAAHAMHPERDDLHALFLADCRFHLTILEATQNQVMRQLQPIILTMLRVSYEVGVRPENAPVTREGHIRVADAIARRDAEVARAAMAEMLGRNESLAHHRPSRASS
jgi:DNA-binding FadR family transcriptional regulator